MEVNQIIQGDCLTILKTLPDESVNCIVTSPPYWGLRDYGIEGQLGLEKTFEEYITKLCDIFDEVKRVLRKDGTCWVNLGDSYNSHTFGKSTLGGGLQKNLVQKNEAFPRYRKPPKNLGDKSLCLIPQRFAIEMVNRGWILRNTIIWHKPNCIPSSAKDRFTVDFEYVYFFVKSKKYWFEQVFEKYTEPLNRWGGPEIRNSSHKYIEVGEPKLGKFGATSMFRKGRPVRPVENGRNKRCVWEITTKGFPEAHFATFPEKLIETPIQAGCPRYVCKKCGKAKEKIYKIDYDWQTKGKTMGKKQSSGQMATIPGHATKKVTILGYTSCFCNAGFEPGICLDPFMGAGTTAIVAKKQGKNYLGIEIKQEYIDMANKRIRKIPESLF